MKRPRLGAWIRWSYVAPRLAAIGLLLAAVYFGLDPALRQALILGGQAALGAKVEVGELRTEWRGGRLRLSGIAAANPSKPMRNLLQAESLEIEVDGAALLRKRLVIREGLATGLCFDGPRAVSGALDEAPPPSADAEPSRLEPWIAAAADYGAAWIDGVGDRVQDDFTAELKSPQAADELEQRWLAAVRDLEQRSDAMQQQGRQLEREFKTLKDFKANPLRALDKLPQLQTQLTSAVNDAARLAAEVKRLPAQADGDRQTLDAARRHDEAQLRRKLQVDVLDGEQLTAYLLGEAAESYLGTAIDWMLLARRIVPSNKVARTARGQRGFEVRFLRQPRPDMLLERLRVEGVARLGGQPLVLTGEIRDVASQPHWHDQPASLHVTGSGAFPLTATVTMDRRRNEPVDVLHLECPQLALSERRLGKSNKLAVTIPASSARLVADVRVEGDRLAGTIALEQSEIALSAATGGVRDADLAQALAASLAEIDGFGARVTLEGTLHRPRWKLASDLGPQVASGVQRAVGGYLAARRDRLAAKVRGELDERLAKLEARRKAAEERLLAKLGENQQLLASLAPLATAAPPGGPSLSALKAVPELPGAAGLRGLAVPALGRALGEGTLPR
jgi:uncharacterized protein (TIGR03545 family)